MEKFKGHIIDFDKFHPTAIVLDIGACVGDFIDAVLKEIDNPIIYAFEPCESNIKVLVDKSIRCDDYNKHVKIWDRAIVGENSKDSVEFVEFVGLPEWGGIEQINVGTKHPKLQSYRRYNVKTLKINNIPKFINYFGPIDYVKIDIEGTETDLIKTLDKKVAEQIEQISIEIHNKDMKELEEVLKGFGFQTKQYPGEVYGAR